MRITFRPEAADKLRPYVGDGQATLKLVYDTEGCGCVVNGVSALYVVQEPAAGDVQGEGDPYPFLYEGRYEVFFEPELKLGYSRERDAFILSSDSQIYNHDLRFFPYAPQFNHSEKGR
ncbi:iron-sulfur cluster biosynthesis family protein [Paenibacillus albicereus]|uniref:Iron-sulfur cluster biosynthesis family protein n=1 Tax=Paenibacillus albicereus TaxID=2726185 RepID=A0A6H2GX27_9BACL|nr:iron-sulfur cluster biosynthesis family protein [Paenibacillus albicereus]QJC51983.1 iron-sulfur cluster biosynthesis family protein [Paenibacillus albicereus]